MFWVLSFPQVAYLVLGSVIPAGRVPCSELLVVAVVPLDIVESLVVTPLVVTPLIPSDTAVDACVSTGLVFSVVTPETSTGSLVVPDKATRTVVLSDEATGSVVPSDEVTGTVVPSDEATGTVVRSDETVLVVVSSVVTMVTNVVVSAYEVVDIGVPRNKPFRLIVSSQCQSVYSGW